MLDDNTIIRGREMNFQHDRNTPLPPQYREPKNGLGLTSLILGIIGTFFGLFAAVLLWVLPMGLGIAGLILGIVGRVKYKKEEATNGKQAVWGIILSAVAIVLAIIGLAIMAAAVHKLDQDLNNLQNSYSPTS